MREALARIDNDFVLSEPRRKGAPRGERNGLWPACVRAVQTAAKHANLMLLLAFAALLCAVLLNALVWQKSRHPAPLFGHSVPIEAKLEPVHEVPVPAARPASISEPAPQPEPAASVPHGRDPMAEAAELQAQPQAQTQTSKPAVASHDPIAQLLKAPSPTPASVPAESSKSILAAQRALMKLGYVVKPDGVMRPATRQALEQFERDHKLPANGTLTPKVLHELSAQSGTAAD